MLKGPYLQNLAPDAITLMWQLDAPEPARVVVTGPGGASVAQTLTAPADPIVELRVQHLQPSTKYRYKVTVRDQSWDGAFATAPPNGADVPFAFVVVGDSRDGVEAHRRVLERMAQETPAFVVGTGDMVDEGGNEDQWQDFFDVEGRALRDAVFWPALGNHDRQGRGRTADAYRAYFSLPENGGDSERYYAFTYATARFLVLDSNANSFALTDQTAWLERALIAARQDPQVRHIFVVMHHPAFSVSLHGGSVDVRERWTPLFEKYQVSAVFSGHDHVYERAEYDGIRYFVSGGGGAPLYSRRPQPNPVDAAAVKKLERTFHYLRVNVAGERIEVTGVRPDGTVIETESWTDAPIAPGGSGEPQTPAQVAVARAGAGGAGAANAAPAAAAETESSRSFIWYAIGGIVAVLAAAVVVVRLRRRAQ